MPSVKPKNTFYMLLGKIGDILLIPIFILALFVSTLILVQNTKSNMPTVFGVSLVRILSGSMRKSGFQVGDMVLINRTNTDELWIGDIIAFYSYADPVDEGIAKTKMNSVDDDIIVKHSPPENRISAKEVKNKKLSIVFHHVDAVYMDESGTRFFQTKGSSNSSVDTKLVREDFVVGKYVNTPVGIRSALRWMSSSVGMVCCVCLPLGFLVILQTLALIEQINFMCIERRLLKNTIHWQDTEAQRLIKTGDMEEMVKIIYYAKVPEDEREELRECLWLYNRKLTKKQIEHRKDVQHSWEILEKKGFKEYLLYWKTNLKSKWDIKLVDEELNQFILDQTL